jgi:hypothetical protein
VRAGAAGGGAGVRGGARGGGRPPPPRDWPAKLSCDVGAISRINVVQACA